MFTDSLRSTEGSDPVLRCLTIWRGSSPLPQRSRGRETNRVRLSITIINRTNVCPARQRRPHHHLWSQKFHDYIFGKKFTITSEHKPLQHLFAENRPISQLASARIQRWALSLSAYEYTIAYKSGDQHANADSLSRLPLPEQPAQIEQPADIVLLLETLQASPVTANNIRRWTDKDPQLSRIRNLVQHGWKDGEKT